MFALHLYTYIKQNFLYYVLDNVYYYYNYWNYVFNTNCIMDNIKDNAVQCVKYHYRIDIYINTQTNKTFEYVWLRLKIIIIVYGFYYFRFVKVRMTQIIVFQKR
jgi:hypothetical protein